VPPRAAPPTFETSACGGTEQISTAIPTIVFEIKDAAGNDVSGVKVAMDGQVLTERYEGSALAVDPGEHVFRFEAPGQMAVQKKYVIVEAVKERRELVQVGPGARPAEFKSSTTKDQPRSRLDALSSSVQDPFERKEGTEPPTTQSRSHLLEWTLIGGGGAAGLAGGALLLVERGRVEDANRTHDKASYDSALTLWTVGLVGAIAGVAAAATGGVVFAVSSGGGRQTGARPASPTPGAWLAIGADGVRVGGAW
jgi:hypothetical protein